MNTEPPCSISAVHPLPAAVLCEAVYKDSKPPITAVVKINRDKFNFNLNLNLRLCCMEL